MLDANGKKLLAHAQMCRIFAAENTHMLGKATFTNVRAALPNGGTDYTVARLVDQLNDREVRWYNLMLEYVAMTLDADAESTMEGFREFLTVLGCPPELQPPPAADLVTLTCFAQARLMLSRTKGMH